VCGEVRVCGKLVWLVEKFVYQIIILIALYSLVLMICLSVDRLTNSLLLATEDSILIMELVMCNQNVLVTGHRQLCKTLPSSKPILWVPHCILCTQVWSMGAC